MLALGIVTLVLMAFVMIYYGYLARNTDHDVSFFLSVGIIMMVMNLCSNSSESARVLAWLYLIVAIAFIGIGFAISVSDTVDFYKSIGPWFVATFKGQYIGYQILSFVLAPVGIVLYFVFHKSNEELAAVCGKNGMWGLLVWVLLIWAISGII